MGRSFLIFQLALLVTWLSSSLLAQGAQVDPASVGLYYSRWYDRGLFGIYPRQWYKSFKQGAPLLNFLQWDDRCDTGMTFMAPRGVMVYHPGPVIMDAKGELVWMEDKYGQAMDFKMQHYKGQDYLTFWRGKDGGNYGIVRITSPISLLFCVGGLHECSSRLHGVQGRHSASQM